MKKILIFICLCFSINLLAGIPTYIPDNENQVKQRSINTRADFDDFIHALKQAYNLGDGGKAYLLGMAYTSTYKLKNGKTIKPDNKKALYWFKKAYKNGYGLAAIQIASLEYMPKGEIFSALDTLESASHGKFTTQQDKSILSITYASLVLEYEHKDLKYVHKAIDFLYPYALSKNSSIFDYSLANLLNLAGRYSEANKFLNSACNNPSAPKQIKYMCENGNNINMIDNKTGKLAPSSAKSKCYQ